MKGMVKDSLARLLYLSRISLEYLLQRYIRGIGMDAGIWCKGAIGVTGGMKR